MELAGYWRRHADYKLQQFTLARDRRPTVAVSEHRSDDPTQENVYDAYDDFTNGNNCGGDACNERVSVSYGVNPPNFTADNQSGTATGSINPGHRLAVDPRNGAVYSLFQRNIGPGAGGSKNIDYMLNRCTDGGTTWTLNGMVGGIIVANADSTQPTPSSVP